MRCRCMSLRIALVVALSSFCLLSVQAASEWQQTDCVAVDPKSELRLMVGVTQRNEAQLLQTLEEVSNPTSDKYGQYLSREEVGRMMQPRSEHVSAVLRLFQDLRATRLDATPYQEFLSATTTVAHAQARFPQLQFCSFTHTRLGAVTIRATTKPALPRALEEAVDLISGMWDLPLNPEALHPVTARRAVAEVEGDAPPAMHAVFGNSGNELVQLLVEVSCVNQTCSKGPAVKGDVTVVATDGSSTTAQTYPVAAPYCTEQAGFAYICTFTIEGLTNFAKYNLSATATTVGGDMQTATFGFPLSPRPWNVPQTVHDIYSVPEELLSSPKVGETGVILWGGQYYNPADFKSFMLATGQPLVTPTIIAPNASAPDNPSMPGGEGQMDIELITSTGTGVHSNFWYASNNIDHGLLDFFVEVAKVASPPLVFSCSWGTAEVAAPPDGNAFIQRANLELAKAGVRGITLAFASGDAGATAAGRGGTCDTLQPNFPASSPYVLSVGGTVLAKTPSSATKTSSAPQSNLPLCNMTMFGATVGCNAPDALDDVMQVPASCCSDGIVWTSAGGFSNNFSRPNWQEEVVQGYLHSGVALPPSSAFNASNRAYPDVVAVSDQVLIFINGQFTISGGTSAATPITAGLMALLNSARMSKGMPPLGFVTPLLYHLAAHNPAAFTDITVGSNYNGELIECPPTSGYVATKGWDAVTGLGTPNIDVLLPLVTAM